MSETILPGLKAQHSIITPECLQNRGRDGAIAEALARARRQLGPCIDGWKGTPANFHVAVTVERLDTGDTQ